MTLRTIASLVFATSLGFGCSSTADTTASPPPDSGADAFPTDTQVVADTTLDEMLDTSIESDTSTPEDADAGPPGTLGPCNLCKSNAECKPGLACLDLGLGSSGRWCVYRKSSVGDCATVRPYSKTEIVPTVGGEMVEACVADVSCTAIARFQKDCPSDFTKCGMTKGEAPCWFRGGGGKGLCSLYCKSDVDCPPGSSCTELSGIQFCTW